MTVHIGYAEQEALVELLEAEVKRQAELDDPEMLWSDLLARVKNASVPAL